MNDTPGRSFAFVVMPFAAPFKAVYQRIVKPVKIWGQVLKYKKRGWMICLFIIGEFVDVETPKRSEQTVINMEGR